VVAVICSPSVEGPAGCVQASSLSRAKRSHRLRRHRDGGPGAALAPDHPSLFRTM